RGVKQQDVETSLVGFLKTQPGLEAAYSRTELLKGIPTTETGRRVRSSFHPGRSGDVFLVERYGYLLTKALTGTNHGTPHDYDTHVPLLLFGPGVAAGVYKDAVTPLAAAVALARGLGIDAPADAKATLPARLFRR